MSYFPDHRAYSKTADELRAEHARITARISYLTTNVERAYKAGEFVALDRFREHRRLAYRDLAVIEQHLEDLPRMRVNPGPVGLLRKLPIGELGEAPKAVSSPVLKQYRPRYNSANHRRVPYDEMPAIKELKRQRCEIDYKKKVWYEPGD